MQINAITQLSPNRLPITVEGEGLIHSYEKEEGLHGLKFIIHRLRRDQTNIEITQ